MGTMYGGSGLWDATVGFGVSVSFYMCGIRSGFWYCLCFCVCVKSERSKMSPTLYSGSVQWDTNYCYSGWFGFCHLGCAALLQQVRPMQWWATCLNRPDNRVLMRL